MDPKEGQGQAGQGAQDPAGGGTQPVVEPTRTFTQAELDAIIGDRLTRERLKYADYDDLKAAKTKLDGIEVERLSELEKAQKKAADAETARDLALQKANDRLIQAAFIAEAAKAGVAHPEDAFALADRSEVSIDDDGAVLGTAKAVDALIKAGRLVMAARMKAPDLDGGSGGGKRAGEKPTPLSPEELDVARKMDLTPEQYADGKRPSRL